MLYIVDSSKEVNCSCYNIMSDHVHADYTNGLTFQEYKEQEKNPHLVVITEEEMGERLKQYRQTLMKKFEEITEEKYWFYLECLPPIRYKNNRFFVGEPDCMDLFMLCFKSSDGKYYCGLRGVMTPDQELNKEIWEFVNTLKNGQAISETQSETSPTVEVK